MSDVKDAQERAIRAAMREERARDAARALKEVESDRETAIAKTQRLRALRLATKPADGAKPKAK
jgi:hypothetical protein